MADVAIGTGSHQLGFRSSHHRGGDVVPQIGEHPIQEEIPDYTIEAVTKWLTKRNAANEFNKEISLIPQLPKPQQQPRLHWILNLFQKAIQNMPQHKQEKTTLKTVLWLKEDHQLEIELDRHYIFITQIKTKDKYAYTYIDGKNPIKRIKTIILRDFMVIPTSFLLLCKLRLKNSTMI